MFIMSCIVLYFLKLTVAQDPVVNLIQGRVVGIKVFMENSLMPIEIYFGIPYAAPPIGRLRFSPPERHMGWKRTYFAHRMAPSCPQIQNESKDSSENCLYLNIWTSRRVDGQLQPVIVIFYSNSWIGGSLHLPCQELASEGVVVVTVAYRLHLLSFFTLKSITARGNLALLDQYMALLWVRENISAFGGDLTSVTLLGHSAGADSVLNHVVSPRTIGLFHRVIIMSPINTWQGIYGKTSLTATEIVKVSRDIAQSMGCLNYTAKDEDILQCMQNKPLNDITVHFSNKTLDIYMQPTPDDFLPESIQYLPRSLEKVLRKPISSNIPLDIMLGTTNLDSFNLHDSRFKNFLSKTYTQIYNFSVEKVIPEILKTLLLNNPETLPTLAEAVKWEYWQGEPNKNNNQSNLKALETLAAMDSAVNWAIGSSLLAEKFSGLVSRLYVYRYSHPSKVDFYGNRLNLTGAVNGADLIALLGDAMMLEVARRQATDDERQISTVFRKYIVSFIKFGVPASQDKWSRFTIKDKNILEICGKEITYCSFRNTKREFAFWSQYLPNLSNSTLRHKEYSERVVGNEGDNRLRGGIFAMCGISVILLLMLFSSGILLHRRRFYRPSSVDSQIAY